MTLKEAALLTGRAILYLLALLVWCLWPQIEHAITSHN